MREVKKLSQPSRGRTYHQSTVLTGVFYGLNRGLTTVDGEMNDMMNLTSDYSPQLAPCLPRVPGQEYDMRGGTYRGSIAKGNDIYSFSGGRMYKNGTWLEGIELQDAGNLGDQHKLLVSMGAYILIWPDKVIFNTTKYDPDHIDECLETMGCTWSGTVTFSPCTLDGTIINGTNYTISDTKPSNPKNGDYWYDSAKDQLMIYAVSGKAWSEVNSTYIRIQATGIGKGFKLNDAINLTSTEGDELVFTGTADENEQKTREALNKMLKSSYVTYHLAEDYIVITGLIRSTATSTSFRCERRTPDFTFACEANNRVWGCQYGDQYSMDGSYVNQLMACALGDPRNWETYDQVSTDSYAVSLGSDGAFTGAIGLNGVPCFFKEGVLTRISGTYPAQFATNVLSCRGVDAGDARSLRRIEQSLIYKSNADILLYNNGTFSSLGTKLGKTTLAGDTIASAVFGLKYYIALPEGIYVYDYQRGLWHRENGHGVLDLIATDEAMWFLVQEEGHHRWYRQSTEDEKVKSSVPWAAVFGTYGYDTKTKKYLSRFDLRMQMQPGSRCQVYIQYDHDGRWHKVGDIHGRTIHSFLIPVIPRRCDHCQLKLEGRGFMRLIALSRILEQGSDA